MKILRIICPVLLGICGIASAHEASDTMKFHSATAIMVGGTELPAGDNTVQVFGVSDGNVVVLVRSEFGPEAFVLTNRLNALAGDTNREGHVTLQHRENGYRLNQIWLADHTGFQILQTRVE